MQPGWAWLRAAARDAAGPAVEPTARLLAGVAVAVARRNEVRLPDLALLSTWGPPLPVVVPDGVVADPWLLGASLEVLLGADERRRGGSHFTPRDLAATVTSLALGGVAIGRATTVCDPAVGGGALLLAAAEALRAAGVPRRLVPGNLSGIDVDPLAVAVAEAGLCLWSGGRSTARLECGDALARPGDSWQEPDVVVGNPPFLGQLRTATSRPSDRRGLPAELASVAGPYTDTASLFAALATGIAAPGGRIALVLPRSFLAARDAGRARARSIRSAGLVHVWLPRRRLFGAAVDVCVPVWERPSGAGCSPPGIVARSVGLPPVPASAAAAPVPAQGAASWSFLLAGLGDEPPVPSLTGLSADGSLGDGCTVTAGFRDQYYGLIPFVVDDPGADLDDATHAPLVTSGLIDPARSAWGSRTTRYAGRRWAAPRVDLAAVAAAGGSLARWTERKRVPKLLVAAQTRTIEAVADPDGRWLPSTPVATVVPAAGRQWHVLAVLLSPVASVAALLDNRGSGLSPGSIRLPPTALRALPAPARRGPWDEAAEAVRAAAGAVDPAARAALLRSSATSMCAAYGLDPEPAVSWWEGRLPAA